MCCPGCPLARIGAVLPVAAQQFRAGQGHPWWCAGVLPAVCREGPLPKHGFARNQAWRLLNLDVSRDDAIAVLALDGARAASVPGRATSSSN